MKKLILSLVFLSAFTLRGSAQLQGLEVVKVPEAQQPYSGEYIYIPDVEGYKTLKCDFHTHTIFSDGDIKPENRVWEAAIRGLDVIAITDHIEYRPNKDYIKADQKGNITYQGKRQVVKKVYSTNTVNKMHEIMKKVIDINKYWQVNNEKVIVIIIG